MHALYARFLFVLLAGAVAVSGRGSPVVDTLGGELKGHLGGANRIFLVKSDITVPPGVTVVIKPGTRFLFRNFTGLLIHGTLMAIGTRQNPIIFTSANDSPFTASAARIPAPYDWNGITVGENASGSVFSHCGVYYSLYGIDALTAFITIEQCRFRHNGRTDVVVRGKALIPDRELITYAMNTSRHLPGNQHVIYKTDPALRWRMTLRGSGLILTAGGAAASIWESYRYREAKEEFDRLNNASDHGNLSNPAIIDEWNEAKDRKNLHLTGMVFSFAVLALGITGFAVSFTF
jgi:hypothetical protein